MRGNSSEALWCLLIVLCFLAMVVYRAFNMPAVIH